MADVTVVMDHGQIRKLETDPPTKREILAAGRGVANRAAADAPKRTGAGAASIRPHIAAEDPAAADVSWSSQYPYMIFHEDGTRYVPAQHFLQHAFERYTHH